MFDFAQLVEHSRAKRWALVALDVNVDTATPAGEMMANVLAVFAQFERRVIGQRTKDGIAAKRREGKLKGPLGRPRTLPDDVRDRIRTERLAGRTLQAIADDLQKDGAPTAQGGAWRVGTISKILRSDEFAA